MSAIIDIGGASILREAPLSSLFERFEQISTMQANGILYPVFSAAGPNWTSKIYPKSIFESDNSHDIVSLAADCLEREREMWLCLDSSTTFLANASSHIVDQTGSSSSTCCINSPSYARAVGLMLAELLAQIPEQTPTGFAIDTQEFWPMGASEGFVEFTCFCSYCMQALRKFGFSDMELYRHFPNPIHLAVKDHGSGLDHIHFLSPSMTPEQIVECSRAEDFLATSMLDDIGRHQRASMSKSWADLVKWSESLISYMRAREHVTFSALTTVANTIRDLFPNAKIAAITGAFEYDWTGGYYLENIARLPCIDEIWLPPDGVPKLNSTRAYRTYFCERARYFPRNLFITIEHLKSKFFDTRSPTMAPVFRQRIASVLNKAIAASPSAPLDFLALGQDTASKGIVVPIILKDETEKLVDSFMPESDSPSLEALQSILETLRDG